MLHCIPVKEIVAPCKMGAFFAPLISVVFLIIAFYSLLIITKYLHVPQLIFCLQGPVWT